MYRGFNGGWANGGYALGFPWGGLIMCLAVIALVSLAVYLVMRSSKRQKPVTSDSIERGLDILIERYARGEIDAETFRRMKGVIESKAAEPLV